MIEEKKIPDNVQKKSPLISDIWLKFNEEKFLIIFKVHENVVVIITMKKKIFVLMKRKPSKSCDSHLNRLIL